MPFIDANHTYSYTQLSSFCECPYGFFLERIERDENGEKLSQQSNAFAEHGTLIHDILDKWAKGELDKDQLTLEYDLRFNEEVVTPFPRMMKNYRDRAYQLGYDYFASFDGFKGMRIIGSEIPVETTIADRRFVGYIDLLMQDEKTDELIVLDHKSKSLRAFKQSEDEMYKQQLLYSKYINEAYGKYPDIMMFNLFKENGLLMSRKFNIVDYAAAIKWAEDTIAAIESYEMLDFLETKPQDFFCTEICSMRQHCANGTANYKK